MVLNIIKGNLQGTNIFILHKLCAAKDFNYGYIHICADVTFVVLSIVLVLYYTSLMVKIFKMNYQ